VLPPNRGFPDVDELRHVLGMTPDIFAAALPYLTLRGSGRINVNAAPEPVLLALPGMTRAAAQELIRMRQSGTVPTSTQQLVRALPAASARPIQAAQQAFNGRVSFRTDEVEIISDGHVEGSAVESRVRLIVVRSDQGAMVVTRVFN
jgi:general secretion pathway protein K